MYRSEALEKDQDSGWKPEDRMTYTSYSNKKSLECTQMSLLYEHRVHPKDFVDYFTKVLGEYTKHLIKLKRQKHAHREQERNFLPSMLLIDIDFSQNFVYTDRQSAIQSDHWKSSSTTIFVAVIRYLCHRSWICPPTKLNKGQAVSVVLSTADGGGDIFQYGEVYEDQKSNAKEIELKIKDNGECKFIRAKCEDIRVRKLITVPLIVVSDTKKHDTYFVRYFLSTHLLGDNGWLRNQDMEPGLAERIKTLHVDSDGASAHFKQRGSLHHITYLTATYGLDVTWTFGCPGHGKGQWDGLGGTVKNKTGNYLKAYDKFTPTPYCVFEVINELFGSESANTSFDSKPHIKIKRWKVLWLPDEELNRPAATISTNDKKSKKKKTSAKKSKCLYVFILTFILTHILIIISIFFKME